MKRFLIFSLAVLILFAGAFALFSSLPRGAPVMSLGISEDGRYVVSAHRDRRLVLWHLEQHSHETVSEEANIYSAAFVTGRDAFLWQDLEGQVRVQSPNGEVLRSFTYVPVYGHLMSADLERYVASNDGWSIDVTTPEGQSKPLKPTDEDAFMGFGKVLNLSISDDGKWLVSAGYGYSFDTKYDLEDERERDRYEYINGVALWSLDTLEPIAKLPGNKAKTHAAISPDGRWVVSGDENGIGSYWNTTNMNQRRRIASYYHGLFLDKDLPPGHDDNWDKSGLIPTPEDANQSTIAVKFIHDSRYYLRFGTYSHTAALFEVDNPWPIKYFDLGDDPFPATASYSRNLAIDTAPEANILVMGQRDGGGILVYRFNPEALTLKRVWVGG